MESNIPRLFGIKHSNRDYTRQETWGKNQFNSSFPASLACYMASKGLNAVYIKAAANFKCEIGHISFNEAFKISPLSDDVYFSFESPFIPFQRYVVGNIPRNDLVIIDRKNDACLSSFEIKLTALPDNSTCDLNEDSYGSEIVIRPDTIIYLACSIIKKFLQGELRSALGDFGNKIHDWTQAENVLPYIHQMVSIFKNIVYNKSDKQCPIILEPIWKTEGKSPKLALNCLDIFIWSDF